MFLLVNIFLHLSEPFITLSVPSFLVKVTVKILPFVSLIKRLASSVLISPGGVDGVGAGSLDSSVSLVSFSSKS
jgi:hypothetical protein